MDGYYFVFPSCVKWKIEVPSAFIYIGELGRLKDVTLDVVSNTQLQQHNRLNG